MESKVKKAAFALLNVKIESLTSTAKRGGSGKYNADGYLYYTMDKEYINNVHKEIDEIRKIIKEYGFDDKLLRAATEKIYDSLIEHREYEEAIEFAKKYAL